MAAAEDEDAEEPRGSGGDPEATRGADPAPGAGEGGQTPEEGARGAARCYACAGGKHSGSRNTTFIKKLCPF